MANGVPLVPLVLPLAAVLWQILDLQPIEPCQWITPHPVSPRIELAAPSSVVLGSTIRDLGKALRYWALQDSAAARAVSGPAGLACSDTPSALWEPDLVAAAWGPLAVADSVVLAAVGVGAAGASVGVSVGPTGDYPGAIRFGAGALIGILTGTRRFGRALVSILIIMIMAMATHHPIPAITLVSTTFPIRIRVTRQRPSVVGLWHHL